MEIRELLQREIWSKGTSRKILSVGVKILRVVEILLVGFVAWHLVNAAWLTASERTAGGMALAKLDDLQHFDGMSEEEYGREYKQADEMVHAAEEAAWTDRDKWIAANLSAYLMSTDVRRHEQESKIKLNNSSDDRVRSFASCPSSMSGNEVESAILHQALK